MIWMGDQDRPRYGIFSSVGRGCTAAKGGRDLGNDSPRHHRGGDEPRREHSEDYVGHGPGGERSEWAHRLHEQGLGCDAGVFAYDAEFAVGLLQRGCGGAVGPRAQRGRHGGLPQERASQKQAESFEKIASVDQQAELRSAEASRRLGALDLRMSGVQGGLGEHKRDILKLREEVNGLTVKSASHEVDIQKNSDAVRKMEKQRNMDEQNWKAQMDAVHDVLDTKVNEKPFEDLKHCVASLTKGTVKFAQVVGVFPGPRFDDADGMDQSEADVELLGWEECAENMSFRVDKAWRQRCSQRFRNILDMIAKKADHSVLRLLQISQQHIESQLERVKHERELWKEVVERRQQQPLQLALSMKEQTGGSNALPAAPGGGALAKSRPVSRPMK